MKKNSFRIAITLSVATYLISIIPNSSQSERLDLIKAILGMTLGVLSIVFMIMSIFLSKDD